MKLIKLSPLIIYVLISACAGVEITPTWHDEVAIVVWDTERLNGHPLFQGYTEPSRLTKEEAIEYIQQLPFDYIRFGKVYTNEPEYAHDCPMRTLGHEMTHVFRGHWHGYEPSVPC